MRAHALVSLSETMPLGEGETLIATAEHFVTRLEQAAHLGHAGGFVDMWASCVQRQGIWMQTSQHQLGLSC